MDSKIITSFNKFNESVGAPYKVNKVTLNTIVGLVTKYANYFSSCKKDLKHFIKENPDKVKTLDMRVLKNLYEYYLFGTCDETKNMTHPRFYTQPVSTYGKYAVYWMGIYMIIKLFYPEYFKEFKRDSFEEAIKEIQNIPELTGNIESDLELYRDFIIEHVMKSEGRARNAEILFGIYFKNPLKHDWHSNN